MKLVQIKTEKEITNAVREFIPGAELVVSYDSYKELSEVQITTPDGKIIRFEGADCSGRVNVHVIGSPDLVKKVALTGTVLGLPFNEVFDYKHEAEDRRTELGAKINLDEDASLEIKTVEVPEVA